MRHSASARFLHGAYRHRSAPDGGGRQGCRCRSRAATRPALAALAAAETGATPYDIPAPSRSRIAASWKGSSASGRSAVSGRLRQSWLKVKCHGREEFIVLGWTPPGGARPGLGSLHVGYYDRDGKLHYAGGVGTGFSEQELEYLAGQARKAGGRAGVACWSRAIRSTPTSTGCARVGRRGAIRDLVRRGPIRHPVYLGLREDKPAEEVVRDVPDPEAKRTALRPRRAVQTTVSKVPRRKVVPPPPSSVLPSNSAPARMAASGSEPPP